MLVDTVNPGCNKRNKAAYQEYQYYPGALTKRALTGFGAKCDERKVKPFRKAGAMNSSAEITLAQRGAMRMRGPQDV